MHHPAVAEIDARVIDPLPSGALIVGIEPEQVPRLQLGVIDPDRRVSGHRGCPALEERPAVVAADAGVVPRAGRRLQDPPRESRAIESALQLRPAAVPGARRLVPLTGVDVWKSGVLEREVDDLLLDGTHLRQDDVRVRMDRGELPLAERLRLP